MHNIVLSIIHLMGKTGRKNNLQSQTNVVGILPLNAVFSLLSYLLSLPMLSIAVNAPNLVHQLGRARKQ